MLMITGAHITKDTTKKYISLQIEDIYPNISLLEQMPILGKNILSSQWIKKGRYRASHRKFYKVKTKAFVTV